MRVASLLVAVGLLAIANSLHAQNVQHSALDGAVVRVLALGSAELHEITKDGTTVKLAVPASGHGSGFVVHSSGLVVTAAHVVKGARHVSVMLPGSDRAYPARVVLANDAQDYAFVRMAGEFGDVAKLAAPEDKLSVRQNVFAVGYPIDATRSDPQSTPGVVSSSLPDGMLQLAMSVNHGNSGGPVIDAQEQVRGILVARANHEQGYTGLAWAVPNQLYQGDLGAILADGRHLKGEQLLRAPEQQKLSDLAALLAYEGPALMRSSVDDAVEGAKAREQRVVQQAEQLPGSAEAQLLAACFFWNRHVLERLRLSTSANPLRMRAKQYVLDAVKLDATLQRESEFVRLVLSDGAPVVQGVAAVTTGSGVPLRFEKAEGSDDVALFVGDASAPHQLRMGYGHISYGRVVTERCQAPCETQVQTGTVELGVGVPGSRRAAGRQYRQIEGPTTVRAEFHSRKAVRGVGVALMIVGGVTGVSLLIAGALVPDCPEDSYDVACPNVPMMAGGGVALGVGMIAGGIMLGQRDKATLNLSPMVSRSAGGVALGGRM
jgi:S1-C subfamily serine protease